MSKKALVAMSGGVDSSVALYLALKAGYECIGVTMKLFDGKNECAGKKSCCSMSDVEDARSVATKFDIPFYVFDYREEFEERVIEKFVWEYRNGNTPNPCIDCNHYMKFQHLYQQARQLGCDVIVTGHYARVIYNSVNEDYELHNGIDEKKDQSYVLFSLNQEQLKHTFFPLGEYTKEEIRCIARDLGLVNAQKPDSQDICFIEGGNYASFLENRGLNGDEGDFVNEKGDVLGKHQGYFHYTIGQRKGLGIAGANPYYVKRIEPESNRVVVGTKEELSVNNLQVDNLFWTSDSVWKRDFDCKVRCRYHQKQVDARVNITDQKMCSVSLKEELHGIAPGQAVVFYQDSRILGGGTILRTDCQLE